MSVPATITPPPASSGIVLVPDMPICQTDLPLDWYQEEFKPYAEEYLALPDRKPETVLPWMDGYIHPALDQRSMAAYCFRAYVWPGRRLRYDGQPLAVPAEGPDEDWVPGPNETPPDVSLGAVPG